jgi:galactoside O-acetyltransferase
MNEDIKYKMHHQKIYYPSDEEFLKEQLSYVDKVNDFNLTRTNELDKRQKLLKEMFLSVGENCYIEPPLHANFGCKHVKLGNSVYANFNLTLVDDTYITIGDNTMIGPNVTLATAGHPILPSLREKGYQFNVPINIGKNVWIGEGACILAGTKIGDGCIIGAHAVVKGEIPDYSIAVGSPARVVKRYNFENKAWEKV